MFGCFYHFHQNWILGGEFIPGGWSRLILTCADTPKKWKVCRSIVKESMCGAHAHTESNRRWLCENGRNSDVMFWTMKVLYLCAAWVCKLTVKWNLGRYRNVRKYRAGENKGGWWDEGEQKHRERQRQDWDKEQTGSSRLLSLSVDILEEVSYMIFSVSCTLRWGCISWLATIGSPEFLFSLE